MRERLDLPEKRSTIKIAANVSAAQALQSMAHAEDAALVVVGSTHTGRAGRVFPGSTGERLLHGSPCTVAVVPQGYEARTLRRVGVAYDGSPESRSAAGAAAELARGTGAELVVIGVAEPFLYEVETPVDGPTAADIVRALQTELDTLVDELPVDATTALLTGDAAELLAGYSLHVDVLVTGSRGYGPARSVLVGGVSGRLLRSARCPVLIVPRGVDAPLGGLFGALVEHA
jgi:nucleotide-binding universal stress UspA family protein